MSTPTMTTRRVEEILLEQIEAGGNVRDLDGEHVSRLAASMKVRGLLTPIDVVAVDGERFALVAGARPARRRRPARRPAPRRGPVARRARRPAHSPRRSRTRSTAQRAGQPVDRLALALGTRVHVDLGARDARVPKHRLRDSKLPGRPKRTASSPIAELSWALHPGRDSPAPALVCHRRTR